MSEPLSMWILGILIAALGGGFVMLLARTDNLRELLRQIELSQTKSEGRLNHFEQMLDIFTGKEFKRMHSPHRAELDALQEEYERIGDLSREQWNRVVELCGDILKTELDHGDLHYTTKIVRKMALQKLSKTVKNPEDSSLPGI